MDDVTWRRWLHVTSRDDGDVMWRHVTSFDVMWRHVTWRERREKDEAERRERIKSLVKERGEWQRESCFLRSLSPAEIIDQSLFLHMIWCLFFNVFILSFVRSFTCSFFCTFLFVKLVNSFARSFIHFLIRFFVFTCIHSFIYPVRSLSPIIACIAYSYSLNCAVFRAVDH